LGEPASASAFDNADDQSDHNGGRERDQCQQGERAGGETAGAGADESLVLGAWMRGGAGSEFVKIGETSGC
jgi:hypothetical protein